MCIEKKVYCIFAANYLPNLGGVERYTYNLSKKLVELGNKVVIVTSNTFNLVDVEEIDKDILIYRMPCYNVLNGRFPVLKYNKITRKLNKKLLGMPIDVVVVNTRFYIHSYYGVKLAKKKKIKPIVIEHGTNHFTVNNKFLDFFGEIYEHFITWLVKRNSKDFYGVSQACSDWLSHFNIESKGMLYNAVAIEEINKILQVVNKDLLYKYNVQEDDIILTYTGRLVKEKGIEKLIKAFNNVSNKYDNVHLFVAGDGELFDKIKLEKNSRLHILGKISFEKVVGLLKYTHIFVLPTDYPEGFPTSVLEAVACKCFIVTTTSGGSKELIKDSSMGIIMKENTVEEIERSLIQTIGNKNYRKEAIEKSYEELLKSFTWDVTTKKLVKIVSEC